jgi:hypothetical protein
MSSGPLLWIHGKRKYTITVVLFVTNDLMTPGLIAGSGKTILRYVMLPPTSSGIIGLKFDKLRDHPAYRINAKCRVGLLGLFLL